MKEKVKYEYCPIKGGCLNGDMARKAGRELMKLKRKEGCIKPDSLVSISRAETAPLHECFTWDDGLAADKCRLEEARSIIRSVRVVVVGMPVAEQPLIRAFVHVQATDDETQWEGQGYIPVSEAASKPPYRQQVLDRAKAELRAWQRRYEDQKDYFDKVFTAIEAVLAED